MCTQAGWLWAFFLSTMKICSFPEVERINKEIGNTRANRLKYGIIMVRKIIFVFCAKYWEMFQKYI